MLAILDQPNEVVQELWKTKIHPSFSHCDGRSQANNILREMEKVLTEDGERQQVRLGNIEPVIRVLKKVVRGLCHYHREMSPVPENQVKVFQVTADFIPEEISNQMNRDHREKDIFRYGYLSLEDKKLHSVWFLTFFGNRHFLAYVFLEAQ